MPIAVLIHDRQAFDAPVAGTVFRDIDDPGIEITRFAGQAFIDGIGNDMGDPPPVTWCAEIDQTGHLFARQDVPKAKLYAQPAIAFNAHLARDKGLGVQHPPIGKSRPGL